MQDKNRNNNWKAKSLERSKTIKACKREIRRLKKNRDKWKNQYKVLQVKTKLTKIKGHRYPMEFIWIGIYMRITLNVSLRSVSKSLKEMSLILGLALPCIEKLSSTTIRNWSLKYGHYALHKDLEKREYALICANMR